MNRPVQKRRRSTARSHSQPRPIFERLEDRLVPSTFTVNSADDSDDGSCDASHCSLREAITASNANDGADTIAFAISGAGVPTIRPDSQLTEVTDPAIIDGTTQPGGFVEIDGTNAGADSDALHISAGNTIVRGLVVNRFRTAGLHLVSGGNTIEGCYIGTDVTGTQALPNGFDGIYIQDSAGNTIGGTSAGARNIISGNDESGVDIFGGAATDNVVIGNWIGTDITGTLPLGNAFDGVTIHGGAARNRVGTNGDGAADEAERNILSASRRFHGVAIIDPGTNSNVVAGNFIGTDATGARSLGNADSGVVIVSGAAFNRIGTNSDGVADDTERNILSGNGHFGVAIFGAGAEENEVAGNFIGTDVSGAAMLPNNFDGVLIQNGASRNTIGGTSAAARNVISGNDNGIRLTGAGVVDNRIEGNFIGTDLTGTIDLGNSITGVGIDNGATGNVIGGTEPGAGNVISGNQGGVRIVTATATANVVQGNLIGTDRTGAGGLGNTEYGVLIDFDASNNTVGGTTAAARNVISANETSGVRINLRAAANVVEGNFIGTDVTGAADLGNGVWGVLIDFDATANTIGGTTPGAGNVISGNDRHGIEINGAGSIGNRVLGNFIGISVTGAVSIGNASNGVLIQDASQNLIGGVEMGAGNVISGNGESGIRINDGSATMNAVEGNRIGTDVTATQPLGNTEFGVLIRGSSGNTIGGTLPGARNVISANAEGIRIDPVFVTDADGSPMRIDADQNLIQGNFIGTDGTGTARLGNFGGIGVYGSFTTIGGTAAGARNIISGNRQNGVLIADPTSEGTVIQGNFIGTDVSGTLDLGNDGVGLAVGSTRSLIGGLTAGAGNVVSGNGSGGVALSGENTFQGNMVGTDVTGLLALGNDGDGVVSGAGSAANTIGGTAAAARNVISNNGGVGVHLLGPGHTVQGNFIGTDATGTHRMGNGGGAFFHAGIVLNGADHAQIGGTKPGAGNLISGNLGHGIRIFDVTATDNVIEGNRIGTDLTGAQDLGNLLSGVEVDGRATNNVIGGTSVGAANTIAFNHDNGVGVGFFSQFSETTGNAIRGNSIFRNQRLGIDLNDDGVSPNDVGDRDAGSNQRQNFPGLTSASTRRGVTRVRAGLNGRPNMMFRIEFFSNSQRDPSGNGEGETFLSATDVRTNRRGTASIKLSLPTVVPAGLFVTATATDPNGNTSEFSPGVVVTARGRIAARSASREDGVVAFGDRVVMRQDRRDEPATTQPDVLANGLLASDRVDEALAHLTPATIHDERVRFLIASSTWSDMRRVWLANAMENQ